MELMTEEKKGFKRTELGDVPEDWNVYKFGDLILDMKGGASLSKSNYANHGIKVIPKGGVGRGGLLNIEKEDQNYCSYEYYKKHLNNAVDNKYTIIVLRDLVPSGPNIGLMVNIESDETYILAQGVYGFRVNPEVTVPEYLVHLSNSNQYRKLMHSILVGSTQVHVRNTTLKNVEIPLPPTLAEQQAIASALSDVDELIRSLDGLIQKKQAIKKGTMQQLLAGKKRLPGFDGEWEVKKLGDVVDVDPENLDSSTNPNYMFDYVSLEDVNRGNIKSKTKLRYADSPSRARRILRVGDVGFGTVRPTNQSHFLIKDEIEDLVCSTGFAVLRPQHVMNSEYLFYSLFTDQINQQISKIIAGSNYPAVNSRDVKKMKISFPKHPEEQKAISQILSDMDRELQTNRQKREKYVHIKQGMMQELLTGRVRLV